MILVSPDSNDTLNELLMLNDQAELKQIAESKTILAITENEIKHDRQSKEYTEMEPQNDRIKKNSNQEDKDEDRKSTDKEKTPYDTEDELSRSGGEKLEDFQPKTDVNNTASSTKTEVNYSKFPNMENEGRSNGAIIYHKEGTMVDTTEIQTKTAVAPDTDNILIEPIETKTDIQSEFLTGHPDVKENSNISDKDESGAKRTLDNINDDQLKTDRNESDDAVSYRFPVRGVSNANTGRGVKFGWETKAGRVGSVTQEEPSKDIMKEMEVQIKTSGIDISLDEQFSDAAKLIHEVAKALIKSATMAKNDLMTRPDVLGFKIDTFEGDEWSKGIVAAAKEVLAAISAMCEVANTLAKDEAENDAETIKASATELKKSMNRLVIAYKVENDTQSSAMKSLKEACSAMNKAAEKLVSSAKQTQSRRTKTEHFTVEESDVAIAKKRIEATANLQRSQKDLEKAQKACQALHKEQNIIRNREDSNLQSTEL